MIDEVIDGMCFACSKDNPIGLKLDFIEEEDKYITHFTGQPEHQSYNGIVHGGIISTILDEVQGRFLYIKGLNAVTAKLEIKYRKPTPIGEKLTIVGWIEKKRGKIYETAAQMCLSDGTVTAESKAVMIVRKGN